MIHRAKIIKSTEITVKIIIVLLGIFILYQKIFMNQNVTDVWNEIKTSFTEKNQFLLMTFAFLLVPINIYMEGIKWKLQIKPIEDISNWKSFLSIFTGMTAGMFFPNRAGNFLGRIFMLEKADRIKAAMVTIVGGMAQMIATVGIGFIAATFFVDNNKIIFLILSVLILTLLILIYFNIHLLKYIQFIFPKKYKEKVNYYLEIFSLYSNIELLKILAISFARYFLYTFQFVLLIWAFNIPLNYFQAMIPISLTYLSMMIIPFITITEIAVRGSVSIVIFEKWLEMNEISTSFGVMVFSASSLLWIFNIAIPAVIGLFLTHRLKFFRNKNES
ncbi:MAG: flippase-like domain-containing protein [Bacteroidales bacterium]|nr:flippase-like domain-containing protein [Bacteroidales bacterium]